MFPVMVIADTIFQEWALITAIPLPPVLYGHLLCLLLCLWCYLPAEHFGSDFGNICSPSLRPNEKFPLSSEIGSSCFNLL